MCIRDRYVSETFRIVSGLRYSEDTFATDVTNFLSVDIFEQEGTTDEITSRVVSEFDLSDDTMLYLALAKGFKPGGTNLTYGFSTQEELDAVGRSDSVLVDPMVFQVFESETVDSFEVGLKSTFADGRARANLAAFSYTYENLQFQATDPDPYRGGVANIPEAEMSGLEIEFTGFLSDSFSVFPSGLNFNFCSLVTKPFGIL